jgi:hypothetical protein
MGSSRSDHLRRAAERMIDYMRSTEVERHHQLASRQVESGLGYDFFDYDWSRPAKRLKVGDARFGAVEPASERDVSRYARRAEAGEDFPPIVLMDTGRGFVIVDGAHRLAAARAAGRRWISAFVGSRKRSAGTK